MNENKNKKNTNGRNINSKIDSKGECVVPIAVLTIEVLGLNP
jgi:hypothetical protein